MSRLLTAVTRATRARTDAERKYRLAIQAARANGHTLREIGEAAGLGVTGVRYLLHPDPRKGKTQ